ncbi:MAG: hypothetical protein CL899_03550 [Dehalococcoidia bacterium]|nr:hypothetical protein [Dehalococcoidia bacterium]
MSLENFSKPKSIAILFNSELREASVLADDIKSHLSEEFTVYLDGTRSVLEKGLNIQADLIISVGGDGTILRCAHVANRSQIPLLGVNMGNLGFLCEVEATDVKNRLNQYLSGSAIIEQRSTLNIKLQSNSIQQEFFALNDFVLARGAKIRVIDVETSINGKHFATYRGDGLVVSTATGSTAYSLSLGGAILSPWSDNMMIKPIASHTSLLGGMVLEKDSFIRLKADSPEDLSITVDGFMDVQLRELDHIDISVNGENRVNFVRLPDFREEYWSLLTRKLELRKGDSLGK